jgi:uncharacterized protein (UPF0335 family)
MTDEPENAGNQLRRLIERVERLEEEKAEIAASITDVFKQAKSAGFDPKVMKAIIRERKMEAAERAEWQALLDTYRAALGMLDGTPLGEAARKRFSRDEGAEGEPGSPDGLPPPRRCARAAARPLGGQCPGGQGGRRGGGQGRHAGHGESVLGHRSAPCRLGRGLVRSHGQRRHGHPRRVPAQQAEEGGRPQGVAAGR